MSDNGIQIGGLLVATVLADFVNHELLPKLGMTQEVFWGGFEALIDDFTPRNVELLAVRDRMQAEIDDWHRQNRDAPHEANVYRAFLVRIGYLEPGADRFTVTTSHVDDEIARTAGPQLVVPVKNARFALNAANARWVSLYDALYGTDVIPEEDGAERGDDYNPVRGEKVITYVRAFLDANFPLRGVHHWNARGFSVVDGELRFKLDEGYSRLVKPEQFRGYAGPAENPHVLLFRNNGLHLEFHIDRTTPVGGADPSGVADVVLEAAVTTIQDCEDSVAAVDATDKVDVYRNWLGLIVGDLTESFGKAGSTVTRILNLDREYLSPEGEPFSLPGRSLMLIRNVGHLMRNDAVTDSRGEAVFEGLLDTMITAAIASLDVRGMNLLKNSRTGSIYIVKPKMHGPDEVEFACDVFARVESLLGLRERTIKIGIMDEERRTSLNLAECISRASDRVAFINTGFLDRTGDEIHTCMEAGPVLPKNHMKGCTWIRAYEDSNADIGLACGLSGKGQIGKGMWAMPDQMARMVRDKIAHLKTGATTAWVPSPTAAVLHAMHYHTVNVYKYQKSIRSRKQVNFYDLLKLPLLEDPGSLSPEEIQSELDNNAQGILGYVVRWIDQGIGCSKVPDIRNIALMEDRATLRISSQHIANWLHHGLCSEQQVMQTLQRMAGVVDSQNAGDPNYRPMAPDFEASAAFQAACSLVFDGTRQPNGYTEPVLHAWRLKVKTAVS